MADHNHARLARHPVANVENQTRGRWGSDLGRVEARREEWRYAVRHCIILVADSSARRIVEAASRGSGQGLGMGSG